MTAAAPGHEPAVSRLDRREQERSLKWFYLLAGANTAFAQCTFGGGLFPMYLRELGLDAQRIGAVMGVIPFMQMLSLVALPLVERLGYRRSYLLFYGSRKLTIAALVFAPAILGAFGPGALFPFVGGCALIFGVQRALGETAFYPWLKEVVPDEIRGRAQGTANLCATVAAGAGLALAGFLVDHSAALGLGRFGGFQAGYGFFAAVGLVGIGAASRMGGGAPQPPRSGRPSMKRRLAEPARDRRFLRFLLGAGVLQGSLALFGAFMALYAKDALGLPTGVVVQMSIAQMAGGTAAGYASGRAADRWGSAPTLAVLLSAAALMPLGWIALSALPPLGRVLGAASAYFLFGVALFGSMVAAMRLMYNDIVPEHAKGAYLALRYAVVGVIAGSMPALAGGAVAVTESVAHAYGARPYTAFVPLFLALGGIWAITAHLFRGLGGTASRSGRRSFG